jgi:hypothetical protein
MINLNLENPYIPKRIYEINGGVRVMEFVSPQKDGSEVPVYASISPHPDPLLVNVYNLAFGPIKPDGTLDDKARLNHTDTSRIFSTAILFGYLFLLDQPGCSIGIDGSDEWRARLYHSMFLSNRIHLDEFFVTLGVEWFVKRLRNKEAEKDENGAPFYKPRIEPFDYNRTRRELYGYYLLQLRD